MMFHVGTDAIDFEGNTFSAVILSCLKTDNDFVFISRLSSFFFVCFDVSISGGHRPYPSPFWALCWLLKDWTRFDPVLNCCRSTSQGTVCGWVGGKAGGVVCVCVCVCVCVLSLIHI